MEDKDEKEGRSVEKVNYRVATVPKWVKKELQRPPKNLPIDKLSSN